MKYVLACFFFVVTSQASVKIACFNKNAFGTVPLLVEFNASGSEALLTYKTNKCKLLKIAYNPTSSQYFGYGRFSPVESKECHATSAALFGVTGVQKDPTDLHWLSVSPEAFAGRQGPIQVGFQNTADPGAGGTAKTMIGCFPARN